MPMSLGHGRGPLKPFGFALPSTALPPYQPVGYVVSEDAEGTGLPTGWARNNGTAVTVNWDYTTLPLDGAQSLYLSTSGGPARTSLDFLPELSEVWIYFLLRLTNGTAPSANNPIVALGTNGSGGVYDNNIGLNSSLQLGASTTRTADAMSLDTTYHVWWHYKRGTGSNGISEFGFSTDGIMPTSGNKYFITATGLGVNLMGHLFLGTNLATMGLDLIIDKIRLSDKPLTDFGALFDAPTGNAYSATTSDSVAHTDVATRVIINSRATADSATSADSSARVFSGTRNTTDAATSADTATRAGTYLRSVTESAASSDAATRIGTFLRSVTQAIASSDVVTRLVTLLRSITQTVTSADVATAGPNFHLAATFAGVGTFTANLAVDDQLVEVIAGSSSVSAELRVTQHLSETVSGSTSVAADLDVPTVIVPPIPPVTGGGTHSLYFPYRRHKRVPLRRKQPQYEKYRITKRHFECVIKGEADITPSLFLWPPVPEPREVKVKIPIRRPMELEIQSESGLIAKAPRLQDTFYSDDDQDLQDALHAIMTI